MYKFIFLEINNTLLNERSCKERPECWFGRSLDKDAVKMLNYICKEIDCKIIILDMPKNQPYIKSIDWLVSEGFEYTQNIIGQVMDLDRIEVKTPYDELTGTRFPLVIGNTIKQWVDNFLCKPYLLNKECATDFEIWEKTESGHEFKGMGSMVEDKDFKYRVVGDISGLLAEQINKNIVIKYNLGLNQENVKSVILSF